MEKDDTIDDEATRQAKRQAAKRQASFVDTELCAYGFLDGPEPPDSPEGVWAVQAQRPFRAHYIWVWGAAGALITEISLHEEQQLAVCPCPIEAFERLSVSPSDFNRFILPNGAGWRVIEPADRRDGGRSALVQLEGAPLMRELHPLNRIREHFTFPAIPAGATIHLGFRGLMRGFVLVGEQIP